MKKDFKNFLWKSWKSLGYVSPTPIQYDMADWLQYGPDKSITMAFRGVGKSFVAVDYGLWALYCDPDAEVLTVSATSRFAGNNARFAYSMIMGFDWLAHMKPGTNQRQSALAFDVSGASPKKSESFCAESLFGQITGRRATLIIPDDVEIPSTCDTETKREELIHRFGELGGAILKPGVGNGVKVLGTCQTEDSLYIKLVQERGYALRMWPILYPTAEEQIKYSSWLAPKLAQQLHENPSLADTSTEPSRFDEADIAVREIEFGRTEFARQFKLHLDAGAGNAAPLKLRDLMVLDWGPPVGDTPLKLPHEVSWGPAKERAVDGIEFDAMNGDGLFYPARVSPPEEWRPVNSTIMYVDPSGAGNDETTWPIISSHNACAFLNHLGKSKAGHTEETLQQIAQDAKTWGVNYIYIESNFGQAMFGELLRPKLLEIGHPCSIEEDRKGSTQKERRIIETLEPVVSSHRLVVNARVLQSDYRVDYRDVEDVKRRFYRLTYQFTRITKERGCIAHDDRVDALASAIGKLVGILGQTVDGARQVSREEAMRVEAEKIIEARRKQGLPLFGLEENMRGLLGGFGRGKKLFNKGSGDKR